MQTREQKYAAAAFTQVSQIKAKAPFYKKYGSMSHTLPVLIRTAGLAQGLAFVESRGTDEHKQLLNDLASTLGYTSRADLLRQSREATLSSYMHLTKQVLDALLWYKRFAQSILGVEISDADMEDAEASRLEASSTGMEDIKK